jgi:hypothetical protein
VKDLAGNIMLSDYNWTFTTGAQPDNTITATAGTGGSISPEGLVGVNNGGNQEFTIAPNIGYHIVDVQADGVSVGAVTTYTFTNVTSNHTISASFAINTFTVTPSVIGGHGSISPNTPQTVNYNATPSFSVTPDAGYSAVMGGTCGGTLNGNTYTTNPIRANCTVTASFSLNTYTITATAGTNGSINPSGPVPVNYNASSPKFTFTPNANYHLADVLVDDESVGAVPSYTFTHVKDDHTISATFAINTFTVTPSVSGGNGSISPATAQTVDYEGTTSFSLTPAPGYHIDTVAGTCGGTLSESTYTTNPITGNCTVVASFVIDDI